VRTTQAYDDASPGFVTIGLESTLHPHRQAAAKLAQFDDLTNAWRSEVRQTI
jgi:hypothetical protein